MLPQGMIDAFNKMAERDLENIIDRVDLNPDPNVIDIIDIQDYLMTHGSRFTPFALSRLIQLINNRLSTHVSVINRDWHEYYSARSNNYGNG